jgi:hypothetical protein
MVMVVDGFLDRVRAEARIDGSSYALSFQEGRVEVAVTPWPRFSLRVLAAREGDPFAAGEVLAVTDLTRDDDTFGLAVTFSGLLALRSGDAAHDGAPDPEVLASLRAYVTSLSDAAGAPDARMFLVALATLCGDPPAGAALHDALFDGAHRSAPRV